jgi:hypothetical protein
MSGMQIDEEETQTPQTPTQLRALILTNSGKSKFRRERGIFFSPCIVLAVPLTVTFIRVLTVIFVTSNTILLPHSLSSR